MARQLKYASSSVESVSSAVTVYGTADAVGENTLATADISLKVSEKNQGTKIKGEVTTTAVATSSDGDGVYASAQTGVEFSGVDKSSALTRTKRSSGEEDGVSWSAETTTTKFRAVDASGRQSDDQSVTVESTKIHVSNDPPADVEGNVAAANVESVVEAGNSLNEASIDVLVITDQYSSVSLSVTATVADVSLEVGASSGYGDASL